MSPVRASLRGRLRHPGVSASFVGMIALFVVMLAAPARATLTTSGGPSWLTGDVNGDGRGDLVQLRTRGISTLLSTGSGGYQLAAENWMPQSGYRLGMTTTRWASADANGDGRADLVHLWSGGINTLLANGDGTYRLVAEGWKPRAGYRIDATTSRWLAADVDGDASADLVHLSSGGMSTLLSNRNGTYRLVAERWKPRADYQINARTTRWLAADVNGDRRADLLHLWTGGINTLLSNANGTYGIVAEGWKPRGDYRIASAATRWTAGDVNGDGLADLVHVWSAGINTLLSSGNGIYRLVAEGFKPRSNYDMNISTTRWMSTDVNGDRCTDLVHVWRGGLNTLLSYGGGSFGIVAEGWKPRLGYLTSVSAQLQLD